jgi:rhomboid protease GluP
VRRVGEQRCYAAARMGADRFLDTVQALLDEPIGGELLGIGPAAAIAALRDGTFAMVVSARVGNADEVEALARDFVKENSVQNLKIIAVGGDAGHRAALERVQPTMMLGRVVQVFAIDRTGEAWAGARSRLDSPVGAALVLVAARNEPRVVDPETLRAKVIVPTQEDRARAEDAREFLESTRRGVPHATIAAIAIIVIMFGLEWMWGGTELVPVLVRMGANGSWALEGEPWRLLSSAWLHAGPLHVLVNAYVLFSLGGFLERMFGGPRFVVLYVGAALGGGIASALLSDAALSVGASGAIWGVLGASMALAWRPADLVPAAVLPGFRKNAIVNVVINVAISFAPGIDMMAHFGGGIVGALLVLSGALTRGLGKDAQTSSRPWMVGATLAGVVMIAAPLTALVVGRPWLLFAPGDTVHELGHGVTIRLPTQLGMPIVTDEGPLTYVDAGDALRDRAGVAIVINRLDGEIPEDELDDALAQLDEEATDEPEQAERIGAREVEVGKGPRAFVDRYRFANGLALIRIHQIHPHASVRYDAVYWYERSDTASEVRAAARTLTIP